VPEQPPIERAFFRQAEDGATVFFPWGLTHRGYRLAGPEDRKKASRAASLLVSSALGIGTWTAYRLQPLLESEANGLAEILAALAVPGAALLLVFLGYWLWAARFVERCSESDLEIPREQRLREAAELASPRKVALIGVVLCGLSAFCIWLQPRAWWLGLLGIALGLGTLFWSRLLARAAAGSSP
jgi:hypothetical protein